jgi:hypothetical protein
VGGPFLFKTHAAEFCQIEMTKSYMGLNQNFLVFSGSLGTNVGVMRYKPFELMGSLGTFKQGSLGTFELGSLGSFEPEFVGYIENATNQNNKKKLSRVSFSRVEIFKWKSRIFIIYI